MVQPNQQQMMTPWQKVAAARRHLKQQMPYLETAVIMLAPVEAPGLGSVAVTETMILLVDLEYAARRPVEGLAADLAHEVSHILRDTHGRTRRLGCTTPEQLKRSNVAADFSINVDLREAGMMIDDKNFPCVFPKLYDLPEGLLHEEYYWALEEKAKEGKDKGKGPGGSDPGEGKCGSGRCGSGGGAPVPNEPGPDDPAGRKPAEIDRSRRHVAEEIMKQAQAGRGNVPGGWLRWAEEELQPPQVPWQTKLARSCRQAIKYRTGAVDFKFNGVSKKQGGVGFGVGRPMLPKLRAPLPEVEVVVDTSGSMGPTDFENMMPEIAAILRGVGAEIDFVAMDAAIQATKRVKDWQEIVPLLRGGGGTNFAEYFESYDAKKQKPTLVIFATDGDAWGVPAEKPRGSEFIWLLTRDHCSPPVSWGEAVHLGDNSAMDQDQDDDT